ncbi:low affinity immunoglobulin gamma Fc region receptor II-a-like isoform X2 [Sebastes umbrosus]|uniref:low affinity immunoglobulin gamma Fc region receptor II-a-like isoform X2 n=1 Tax=Sebastes umbrosus TaxID=72105 RepID=UPI0018A0DADF|nr:low affinity immunoglobulin gamma Fc region receptor II-a-like isoform X2 [Sebastes umbrosus]
MEVTALCFRLMMNVLMLLVAHVQQSYSKPPDAAFCIVPNRLQLFEYGSVYFTCEGVNASAGWKVRNINRSFPKCSNSTVASTVICTIDFAFASDSGEYWCEGGRGERSNTVNITVTAGSVILESPVLPVMEGDDVTLSCRNKKTSSDLTADFYKDGRLIRSSSTGNMTIHSVSKSDEGLYKCNISGAGGSPQSWLAIRESDKDINFSRHYYILLWTVVTVVLFLQLLVMGLLYWKKQLVLLEAKLNDPNKDLYTVIKKYKKKKKKKDQDEPFPQSFNSTFAVNDTSAALQNEPGVSSFTVTADLPTDEDAEYEFIQEIDEEETPN